MDIFQGLDWGTYSFFHYQSQQLTAVLGLMKPGYFLGAFGSYVLWAGLLVLIGLTSPPNRAKLIRLTVASLLAMLLLEMVRWQLARPRPNDAGKFFEGALTGSFPAGPVALWAVMLVAFPHGLSLAGMNRQGVWTVLIGCFLLLLYIMFSQLFLGLNFLSDVLAGLIGGLGLGLLSREASR